jgi:hypothetical protein
MGLKGKVDLYSNALEQQLDAMTIVPAQQKIDDGCVVNITAINYSVWILISLMPLILIPRIFVDVFMIIYDLIKCGKEGSASRADLLRSGPVSTPGR